MYLLRSCWRSSMKINCLQNVLFTRTFLTSTQTTEVLRPFLFAVHPDFFGQHPMERGVNERSLKQLFAYIDGLHKEWRVTATDLTFYLRKGKKDSSEPITDDSSEFRSVSVTLSSPDVYTTVQSILEVCALPTALVRRLKDENDSKGGAFPRPVEWHPSYYAYTGKENPHEKVQRRPKKPEITLSYWLKTNVAAAREKLASSRPTREEVETLRKAVIGQLGLVDVRWESTWDAANCRSCLRTMQDLCKQHWAVMQNLRGSTVILGDVTMLSPKGLVVLGSQDVPHHWVSFISCLPQQREVLQVIPPTEQHLSTLLGGCRVTAMEGPSSTMTAHGHYGALVKLAQTMEKHNALCTDRGRSESFSIMPQKGLEGVRVVIEGSTGEQYMASNGDLHIMCNKSASNVIEFLLKHSHEAREICAKHKSDMKEEALLIASCLEELELATLTRHLAVTPSQMIRCCRKLQENPVRLGVMVTDLHVKVSHHYSLMRDGNMCIPWNWKQ